MKNSTKRFWNRLSVKVHGLDISRMNECVQCGCNYTRVGTRRWKCTKGPKSTFERFCSVSCRDTWEAERRQVWKSSNRCEIHPKQDLSYHNICWNCWKDQWIAEAPKLVMKGTVKYRFMGFKVVPTFRTSSESWSGSREAFERNLMDMKVGWFVYIKMYMDRKGRSHPLVCGKSGSRNVQSGSDLNFSLKAEDGPARRFLLRNGLEWDISWILLKRCRTESEAYELERKVLNGVGGIYGS